MTMTFMEKFMTWYNYSQLDQELRQELEEIKDSPAEIEERFYKDLEFGTGGLRGIIGAGTNRMNIYTVSKASQGLANFINKAETENQEKKVVIAYDSRHKSKEFALRAALVLANNNVKAYVFEEIAPTPLLSYAVCQLKATAGIVVTASHNPKEYNGYKVYWSHGGQVTDQFANAIISEVTAIENDLEIPAMDLNIALEKGLLEWLDDSILNSYIAKTKSLVINKDLVFKEGHGLNIIYTPLHGTGSIPVARLLMESGFTNLQVVTEQKVPDPDFKTVTYPNPEEKAAFGLALDLALKTKADLIMGTDPDADRIGVLVKDEKNDYALLSGNQLGALLLDYILKMKKAYNSLPNNSIVIKTIVTSTMGVDIAARYGVGYIDVLTGFKYIGEKIAQFQENNEHTFLFGYEESYGFLASDFVRDKDGVQIALITAEMALYYKSQGLTLTDRLEELFEEYGYYQEDLINLNLSGIEGQKRIINIIEHFRKEPPKSLNNLDITLVRDYLSSEEFNLVSGKTATINLPKSNVLHYTLEDNSWLCVRPSGTEPKLKFYVGTKGSSKKEAQGNIATIKKELLEYVDRI